jgi:predicted metal-binding membrane protein
VSLAAPDRRSIFLPLIIGLVLLAWVSLFLWEASPYGRFLHHADWTAVGLAGRICSAVWGGHIVVPALIYVGGWLLMSGAMMLPTALPLLAIFGRLTEPRSDRAVLRALVVGGYLLVWTAFGLLAHVADAGSHGLVASNAWLALNGWIVGAGVLGLAGVFQFTALKYYCLDKCRTPFSFVHAHWRGRRPRLEALRLGVDHGVFCVGCCWAIMLLMFVVGAGSVGWMLVLGAVMAIEKNARWGRRLSAPLGVGLIVWSGAIVAQSLWRWTI